MKSGSDLPPSFAVLALVSLTMLSAALLISITGTGRTMRPGASAPPLSVPVAQVSTSVAGVRLAHTGTSQQGAAPNFQMGRGQGNGIGPGEEQAERINAAAMRAFQQRCERQLQRGQGALPTLYPTRVEEIWNSAQ